PRGAGFAGRGVGEGAEREAPTLQGDEDARVDQLGHAGGSGPGRPAAWAASRSAAYPSPGRVRSPRRATTPRTLGGAAGAPGPAGARTATGSPLRSTTNRSPR